MRPDSALLKDLAGDPDPWGPVEVHAFWTPRDLMILPPKSSRLPRVKAERTFPGVYLHRWMVTDPTVLDAVAAVLAE